MTIKKYKTLETPIGSGAVYDKGSKIATARYRLIVNQQVHVVHSFGGTEDQIDGLTDANGVLTVVDGERSLMNTQSPLTLELEDGRQMEFLATNYDPVSDTYQIVRTGDWQ